MSESFGNNLPVGSDTFDWEGFDTFLVTQATLAPDTIDDLYRCLRRMFRRGFIWQSVEDEAVTGLFLKQQAPRGASEYKKNVQVVNLILRWQGSRLKYPYPKRQRSQPVRYKSQELRSLRAFGHSNPLVVLRNRALVEMALQTGMRRGEVARFRVNDLDVDEGTLEIKKPSKNGLIRTIPVDPSFLAPKGPFMSWLRARPVVHDDPGAVWVNLVGGQPAGAMSKEKVGQLMTVIGKACGVRANFNRSRHTRATELLQRGLHPRYVQFYLGHADLKATMVYMEADEYDLKREFEKVRRKNKNDK